MIRAGRRRAGTFVLVFAALVACTLASCTTAAQDAPPGAVRPRPEIAPIARLGRWDGVTFVPVSAASVACGDLVVLVHGWAPGYRDAVRRFRGPGPLLLWDPSAVNAQGIAAGEDLVALAAAIAGAEPSATIVAYSWLDDSATADDPLAARAAAARTDLNGQRLGFAISQLEAPGFAGCGGRVHLIGHSFGAKVATVAAIGLDPPPTQLTLLDSPENAIPDAVGSANQLDGYLPLLPVGRAPGATFVDAYFSLFGAPYAAAPGLGAVVDVHLLPAQYPLGDLTGRHEYPILWYAHSARDLGAGVGLAWSPFVGGDPARLAGAYEQDWIRRGGGVDHARELDLRALEPPRPRPVVRTPLHATLRRGVAAGRDFATLDARHPRWEIDFTTAPRDLALEFDARFIAGGSGSLVGIWIDGSERYSAAAAWSATAGEHAVVDVSTLAPGRHHLTAVLAPGASEHTRFAIGGLRTIGHADGGETRGLSSGARAALAGVVLLAMLTGLVVALAARLRPRRGRAEG